MSAQVVPFDHTLTAELVEKMDVLCEKTFGALWTTKPSDPKDAKYKYFQYMNDEYFKSDEALALTKKEKAAKRIPQTLQVVAKALTKLMPVPLNVYDVCFGLYRRRSKSVWEGNGSKIMIRVIVNLGADELYAIDHEKFKTPLKYFVPTNNLLILFPDIAGSAVVTVDSDPSQKLFGASSNTSHCKLRMRNYLRTSIVYDFHSLDLNMTRPPPNVPAPVGPDSNSKKESSSGGITLPEMPSGPMGSSDIV
jgi:hypothetical protein